MKGIPDAPTSVEDLKAMAESIAPGGEPTPEQRDMMAEIAAIQGLAEEYANTMPEEYQDLGSAETVAQEASWMADIKTDPRFSDAELASLTQLETMADEGLTATDRADMSRIEGSANRNLQGQMGAINQQMQARGISGSGLDMVSQQNAAQAMAEKQAMQDLEVAAQGQQRRESATFDLGRLGSQLGAQDFDRQARQAQAQDVINRFNTSNTNQANVRDQQRQQGLSDRNVTGRNVHADNAYNARMGAARLGYDAGVDQDNQANIRHQQGNAARRGQTAGIGSAVGGVAGAIYGGPAGAAAGSQIGGQAGGAYADSQNKNKYAHGGKVPMDYAEGGGIPGETNGIDSYADDTVEIMVQPGEIVIPETVAQSPEDSAAFVAEVNGDPMAGTEVGNPEDKDDDVVGMFIKTVSELNKKKRRV